MSNEILNLREYADRIYQPLKNLNDKGNVILVKNKIDSKACVLKYVKSYERGVYEALKNVQLSGIPEIYEIVSEPEELLIIEEYIEGLTLNNYIEGLNNDKKGDLISVAGQEVEKTIIDKGDIEKVITNIIGQLCIVLNSFHSLQPAIIHRDIKPENILIDGNGKVYLIDFNISRHFKGGADHDTINMGTTGFAAPEQFGFGESSIRTDIYGLGATIKYICEKNDIRSLRLVHFVNGCMALSPEDRFPDALTAWKFLADNEDSEYFFRITDVMNIIEGNKNSESASYMERRVRHNRVLPLVITCEKCNGETEINSHRSYINCRKCGNKMTFKGFDYQTIDWGSSMYSSVEYWTDCPVCRSPNMYLGPEGKVWKCPDCLYKMTAEEKDESVFWFCDDCETFLNIQPGFNVENGHWKCTECGYENDVTDANII